MLYLISFNQGVSSFVLVLILEDEGGYSIFFFSIPMINKIINIDIEDKQNILYKYFDMSAVES